MHGQLAMMIASLAVFFPELTLEKLAAALRNEDLTLHSDRLGPYEALYHALRLIRHHLDTHAAKAE